jgi:hypothetical protein
MVRPVGVDGEATGPSTSWTRQPGFPDRERRRERLGSLRLASIAMCLTFLRRYGADVPVHQCRSIRSRAGPGSLVPASPSPRLAVASVRLRAPPGCQLPAAVRTRVLERTTPGPARPRQRPDRSLPPGTRRSAARQCRRNTWARHRRPTVPTRARRRPRAGWRQLGRETSWRGSAEVGSRRRRASRALTCQCTRHASMAPAAIACPVTSYAFDIVINERSCCAVASGVWCSSNMQHRGLGGLSRTRDHWRIDRGDPPFAR